MLAEGLEGSRAVAEKGGARGGKEARAKGEGGALKSRCSRPSLPMWRPVLSLPPCSARSESLGRPGGPGPLSRGQRTADRCSAGQGMEPNSRQWADAPEPRHDHHLFLLLRRRASCASWVVGEGP